MQEALEIYLPQGRSTTSSALRFAVLLLGCVCGSALLAAVLPLPLSIVTVFLFAGPHNWFEFRYFLTRLPVRFGKSRSFFLTAFAGIGFLTLTYFSLPILFANTLWSEQAWLSILATWNLLLLLWVATLMWLRGRQKSHRSWAWSFPVALALSALNWLAPELFSLAIVYLHPLVALWFLDRHLARTRPEWLGAYRRVLAVIPVLGGLLLWQLSRTAPLPDDNGLFWRITQHSGAELLRGVSSHALVSVQLFLEILHYGVWLVALPLITKPLVGNRGRKFWSLKSIPVAQHPRGFPKLVGTALVIALLVVVVLWVGFSFNYSATRDFYFTIAIAHVLAEAPFLLKML